MTLRSYGWMSKKSEKVKAGEADFRAVYDEVDARSEWRCEVWTTDSGPLIRCPRRANDHHHLARPRRANHVAAQIVHICRICHDRTEWPYQRGRLVFQYVFPDGFMFAIRYAASKFEARQTGAV